MERCFQANLQAVYLYAVALVFFVPLNVGGVVSDVQISGEAGIGKGLKEAKILKLDKGVVVEAEIALQGRGVTYQLRSVNGVAIPLLDQEKGPQIRNTMVERFRFKVPKDGKIRLQVISSGKEALLRYFFRFKRRVELDVQAEDRELPSGRTAVQITAKLVNTAGRTIRRSDSEISAWLKHPEQEKRTIDLYDDGLHGDGDANDGVYGYLMPRPEATGQYKIVARLKIRRNNKVFQRESYASFVVSQ